MCRNNWTYWGDLGERGGRHIDRSKQNEDVSPTDGTSTNKKKICTTNVTSYMGSITGIYLNLTISPDKIQ